MTIGPNHYVPVLKLKQAEKHAIPRLSPTVLAQMTPLFEIVKMTDKPLKEHLITAFRGIDAAVERLGRYFLDAREIEGTGPVGASTVFRKARALGRPFTPVTGITRTADVGEAIKAATDGIALRLTRQEFEGGLVPSHLLAFMKKRRLGHESTDLLVDLGPVEDMIPVGISRFSAQFLAAIPDVSRWRSLILIASAFPRSMGIVAKHAHALVDRSEWISWRDSLYAGRANLGRLPTFGDCGIQHPQGVEGIEWWKIRLSAVIRYTLENQWLLIKGEIRDNTALKLQFPKLVVKLTKGSLSGHFAGADHCDGCACMVQAAGGAGGFGSLGAWRRLGTIHHITTASEQIADLAWP